MTSESRSWSDTILISSQTWTTLPGSEFTATVSGGPLLMYMSVSAIGSVSGGSSFSCQPILDNAWAGSFGGLPDVAVWREGLSDSRIDWRKWSPMRLYPGIPAGTYTFAVQCFVNTGTLRVNQPFTPPNPPTVVSSWGFIELN